MSRHQQVWTNQRQALAAQIEAAGAVLTCDDGAQVILPNVAPAEVMAAFHRSTVVGAAKGWL